VKRFLITWLLGGIGTIAGLAAFEAFALDDHGWWAI
jgi:hypothetical protein